MKIWTEAETEALRQRYPVESCVVLAEIFGVSVDMVRRKAHALGVNKLQAKANTLAKIWTEDEDARIRREWPQVAARVKGHTANRLAQRLRVSEGQLRHRVSVLGLRRFYRRELPWSDEEIDLLDRWAHLPPPSIRHRLAKRGYQRSEAAIAVARHRQLGGLRNATTAYSATQLGQILGTSQMPVIGWIRKGWLKATPRGDTVADHGGPGDRWMIYPRDVRKFIADNPALVGPNVNLVWLIDLLANPSA